LFPLTRSPPDQVGLSPTPSLLRPFSRYVGSRVHKVLTPLSLVETADFSREVTLRRLIILYGCRRRPADAPRASSQRTQRPRLSKNFSTGHFEARYDEALKARRTMRGGPPPIRALALRKSPVAEKRLDPAFYPSEECERAHVKKIDRFSWALGVIPRAPHFKLHGCFPDQFLNPRRRFVLKFCP